MAPRHCERTILIAAPPEGIFDFVDDHSRLSSHMNESSWMMGGGCMTVETDAAKGQAVGSHIRISGRGLGVSLSLDEVVTRHEPPREKRWETVGTPRLVVIGSYQMGVKITPTQRGSSVRVYLDYELPHGPLGRWLGRVFAGVYASWCVRQILSGISRQFGGSETRVTGAIMKI
jgi:hypothetical protein